MSLRIALLGMLAAKGPASGYELAKLFDRSINLAWQAKHSQIYPELGKMVESGAVTVEEAGGGRGRKVCTVTQAGRDEIKQWLTDGDLHRSVRNEIALRAFLVPILPPAEAAAVMRAEAERQAAQVAELTELKARDKPGTPTEPSFGTYALDLGIRSAELIRQWATETADDLERRS